MQLAVCHFTVGRDSRALIRDRGLAAFLFPKSGAPFQFCEANAITAHACEWNTKGPGLEVERLSWAEPFTTDQTRWVGEVCRWLSTVYGIPLVHHATSAGRLPIGSTFRGFADHGALVHRACDQHTDGWTDTEWAAAIGGPGLQEEDDGMGFTATGPDGTIWHCAGTTRRRVSWDTANALAGLASPVKYAGAIGPEALAGFSDSDGFLARLFPAKAARAGTP